MSAVECLQRDTAVKKKGVCIFGNWGWWKIIHCRSELSGNMPSVFPYIVLMLVVRGTTLSMQLRINVLPAIFFSIHAAICYRSATISARVWLSIVYSTEVFISTSWHVLSTLSTLLICDEVSAWVERGGVFAIFFVPALTLTPSAWTLCEIFINRDGMTFVWTRKKHTLGKAFFLNHVL